MPRPAKKASRSGSYVPHADRKGHRIEVYLTDDEAKCLRVLMRCRDSNSKRDAIGHAVTLAAKLALGDVYRRSE
jgi:hypothetical protein